MPYFTYILYSEKTDRYYVGNCEDMEMRLALHNSGRNKSIKYGAPWKLKYTEAYTTRSEAVKREKALKAKKSRRYLEWLTNTAG
ncbi:GIY-YIG nuclease family protein [Pontibacter mangrovi]|uniref:GIY-YIG nuclease family protein n=1 Tax=Pontibacter mangrovi TaxID=2589816 RepID=A0A501WDV2_9BACT|nr:GIY-YIG nuclease family protein [Pontibacter mangrovi]TPE43696.1 GIY-YIG nuclease family protein [Pontibacter mangrovi]